MDSQSFEQSPAGRLVRGGPGGARYSAFVPNPLPPHLEMSLPLVRTLSEADRALGERGAWAAWVRFFLQGIVEQARDAVIRAKKLQDLQAQWRQQLQAGHVVGLAASIADFLFESPVLSIREIAQRFGTSHYGASKALGRLWEMRIVHEITGRERYRLYMAGDILRIVE